MEGDGFGCAFFVGLGFGGGDRFGGDGEPGGGLLWGDEFAVVVG